MINISTWDKVIRILLGSIIVGILIALSYYNNTAAINLFSILAAVVSTILAVYSLFTSNNNNDQVNKVFTDLQTLNTKIDTKLDYIKEDVKRITTVSSFDNSNKKEENQVLNLNDKVTVYVEHLWCESKMEISQKNFKMELRKSLLEFNSNCEIISANILHSQKDSNVVTILIVLDGKMMEDAIMKIVEQIKSKENVIKYGGLKLTEYNVITLNI